MKNRQQTLLMFFLVLISAIAFSEAQCPAGIVPVRYLTVDSVYMTVSVTVNHSRPSLFLVDTGSETTIIEPSLAAELHLGLNGDTDVVTGLRHTRASIVSAHVIELGSLAFYGP